MTVTGPIPVRRVKDRALARGKTVVESEGQPPSATSVTRTVYSPSGRLLRRELWNTSYKAEPTVLLVGTKGAPKKPKKPAPKAPTPGRPEPGVTTPRP